MKFRDYIILFFIGLAIPIFNPIGGFAGQNVIRRQSGTDAVSDHGGQAGAGHAQFREKSPAKNQTGGKNRIADFGDDNDDHRPHRIAGGAENIGADRRE